MFDRLYPCMQWPDYRHVWPNASCSQFVNAGGLTWHVQTMGQGPCLLLLHGTGSGNFSWRASLPLLSRHFTVLAPDLPGHVFSTRGVGNQRSLDGMSDALMALLGVMGHTPAVLVGHSAGAAVAANMVLRHASLNDAHLIGLNPAWLPLPGVPSWVFGPAAKLAALNPLSAWATTRFAKKPDVVGKWVAQTGSHLATDGLALYRSVFTHPGHVHSVLGMMAAWQLSGLSGALSRIRNKVTIVAGANDKTIPVSLAYTACSAMPQTTVVVQEGLGHLAHEERPDETTAAILRACGVN